MFEVLAKTGVKEEELAAIGITNQRETTVIWDKKKWTAYLLRNRLAVQAKQFLL